MPVLCTGIFIKSPFKVIHFHFRQILLVKRFGSLLLKSSRFSLHWDPWAGEFTLKNAYLIFKPSNQNSNGRIVLVWRMCIDTIIIAFYYAKKEDKSIMSFIHVYTSL